MGLSLGVKSATHALALLDSIAESINQQIHHPGVCVCVSTPVPKGFGFLHTAK